MHILLPGEKDSGLPACRPEVWGQQAPTRVGLQVVVTLERICNYNHTSNNKKVIIIRIIRIRIRIIIRIRI